MLAQPPRLGFLFLGVGGGDHVGAGAGDAGAYGADAYTRDFGGFFVGVSEYLGEYEGFATFGRKGVDKQARVYPFGPGAGGGGARFDGFRLGGCFARARHVVADVVYPDAAGEGEDPGAC